MLLLSQQNKLRPGQMTTDRLLPHHRHALEVESGVLPAVLESNGVYSATTAAELVALGFRSYQALAPAIVFPFKVGAATRYRIRPDHPRLNDRGKLVKYEQPTGTPLALYIPARTCGVLGDPSVLLLFTEGEKKALAAESHGLACISLPGVWGWRGTNPNGGKTALGDFESIALNGRRVYIAFDSDISIKEVRAALTRFVPFLESRGAQVSVSTRRTRFVKVGLDDYLLTHSAAQLLALAEQPREPGAADETDPWDECGCGCADVILAQRETIAATRAERDLAARQLLTFPGEQLPAVTDL